MKVIGCGVFVVYALLIAVYIAVSYGCVQYCVNHWFHRALPAGIALAVAVIAGEIAIPSALVTWLLVAGGVIQ